LARRERILELVIAAISELNQQRDPGDQVGMEDQALLYGQGGPLDSLGFVNFIADLEGRVETEFGQWINLADEELLAREESPFQNPGALATYIDEVL